MTVASDARTALKDETPKPYTQSQLVALIEDYDKRIADLTRKRNLHYDLLREEYPNAVEQLQKSATNPEGRGWPLLLKIVGENDGKLTKEELITEARRQGMGNGNTEGKKRGSIGAQIEKLLRPDSGKLMKRRDGKLAIP